MLEILRHPWHWSVAGVLIGLTVPLLYIIGNKPFGISSSFRHICAACLPSNAPYFKYDWRKDQWNLFFVGGILIGGFIGTTLLANPNPFLLASETHKQLSELGITEFSQIEPTDIFNFQNVLTIKGFIFIVIGGFLVGFGTRYAGGCTSGHAITGIANFQLSSFLAAACFMAGGFTVTHLLFPLIFKL